MVKPKCISLFIYNFILKKEIITESNFRYIESGEGKPVVILHGLMGGLSNFAGVLDYFPDKGFKIVVPELPVYDLPLSDTTVKSLANFLNDFLIFKELNEVILLGNSLGGHIALLFSKFHPKKVKGLIITGSSGLYENAMGDGYPKRGDYDYIKTKSEEVFYDSKVATKEIVDEVFETVNDRNKLVKTLAIAKSAIRHNMAKDLPSMDVPVCLIWGKNDIITPPEVAEEFLAGFPDADLHWIDECGHAPMMEHPDTFNTILSDWYARRGIS